MSQLTITLTHEQYLDLDLSLKIKSQEHRDAFKTQDKHVYAVLSARNAIGMSTHPRHLYSDYDAGRDEPRPMAFSL